MKVDGYGVLRSVRKGWWVGLCAVVVTPLAAAWFTARQQPVYRAAASAIVSPDPGLGESTDVLRATEALERRSILATFAEISMSPAVRRAAADRLEWEAAELADYRVASSVLPHANVVRVTTAGPDAERTAALAQAVVAAMAEEAHRLYRPFAVGVLSEATPPPAPTSPDRRRNFVVAMILGLFLGTVAAYAFGRAAPYLARFAEPKPSSAHAATD